MTGEHLGRRRLPGSGRDRVSIGTAGPWLSMGGSRRGAPRARKEGSRIRGSPGGRQGVAWTSRHPKVCRSECTVCPGAEPQVDAGPVRGNALPQETPAPGPDFWQCPGSSLERGQADPWAHRDVGTGQPRAAGRAVFSPLCTGSHRGARSVSFPLVSKDEGDEVMKSPGR